MGSSIEAWIEYDDDAQYYPERAAEPPFSRPHDNCIPLTDFVAFRSGKNYRFFAAISGTRSQQGDPTPLFPLRGGLPPNVSGYTMRHVFEVADDTDPNLGWLTYPEIKQAVVHTRLEVSNLSFATTLVLDLMKSIEMRLGEGRSRLIFYIE